MRVRKYKDGDLLREEVLLSRSEQEGAYHQSLKMVLDNPRWVLDNLESLDEFRVNWKNYKKLKKERHSG